MPLKTQTERLAEKIPKLEQEFGADNPYVQGLKRQLVGHQRQVARKQMFNMGTMSAPKK